MWRAVLGVEMLEFWIEALELVCFLVFPCAVSGVGSWVPPWVVSWVISWFLSWLVSRVASRVASWLASCVVSGIGIIRDLEEPERDMVEMRVAARHSGMSGAAVPMEDSQETCHLSRVTAEVLKWKKPSCARQEEQKAFRLRFFGLLVFS